MARYLLLVLLVCALVWMIRGERRAALRRHARTGTDAPRGKPPSIEGGRMVACTLCDLHLPMSEAVPSSRSPTEDREPRWFCCEAHRAQFEQRTPAAGRSAQR